MWFLAYCLLGQVKLTYKVNISSPNDKAECLFGKKKLRRVKTQTVNTIKNLTVIVVLSFLTLWNFAYSLLLQNPSVASIDVYRKPIYVSGSCRTIQKANRWPSSLLHVTMQCTGVAVATETVAWPLRSDSLATRSHLIAANLSPIVAAVWMRQQEPLRKAVVCLHAGGRDHRRRRRTADRTHTDDRRHERTNERSPGDNSVSRTTSSGSRRTHRSFAGKDRCGAVVASRAVARSIRVRPRACVPCVCGPRASLPTPSDAVEGGRDASRWRVKKSSRGNRIPTTIVVRLCPLVGCSARCSFI